MIAAVKDHFNTCDTKFKRIIVAENQPEYKPLPVVRSDDGTILICWKLSLLDRLRVFFNGKLYHQVMTFGSPLQPIRLTTDFPGEWK